MNVETRGRSAADGLLRATPVSVEAGLSRLRGTRRRRGYARVVAACVLAAAVAAGALVTLHREEKVAPVKVPQLVNGPIINAGERQIGAAPTLPSVGPYPLWQGVDPSSGSFLFTVAGSVAVGIVDPTGAVTRVECPRVCELSPYPGQVAFGPGADELTFSRLGERRSGAPSRALLVAGYDGEVHEKMDLSDAGIRTGTPKLIAWSPDRRQLALATASDVWIIPRDGHGARLIHREKAPRQLVEHQYVNEPVVVDLAWSPDGGNLGILVANEFQGDEGARSEPSLPRPRLIEVSTQTGNVHRLHTFDFRDTHSSVSGSYIREWSFAWSPDGKRLAVTDAGGTAEISATSGTVLARHPGANDYGPLVWLPR